jgi:hypothetical protein
MARRLIFVCLIGAAALVAIPATSAKDGDVLVRGTCTGASSSKLKLSPEDGLIEVEFEVDQNRNGVRWTVVLRRPARVVFRGAGHARAERVIRAAACRERHGRRRPHHRQGDQPVRRGVPSGGDVPGVGEI